MLFKKIFFIDNLCAHFLLSNINGVPKMVNLIVKLASKTSLFFEFPKWATCTSDVVGYSKTRNPTEDPTFLAPDLSPKNDT